MDVALAVNNPLLHILSFRSLVALAAFLVAAFFMARTRVGRDIYATGSDRRAAMVAGVRTSLIIPAVFACSGMLAALGGSLLSYSLAAASGEALTDALVPATAAAIIGGVSLMGGKGTPIGIIGGVLVLCLLRAGLERHRHAARRAGRRHRRRPVPGCRRRRGRSRPAPVRNPALFRRIVFAARRSRRTREAVAGRVRRPTESGTAPSAAPLPPSRRVRKCTQPCISQRWPW